MRRRPHSHAVRAAAPTVLQPPGLSEHAGALRYPLQEISCLDTPSWSRDLRPQTELHKASTAHHGLLHASAAPVAVTSVAHPPLVVLPSSTLAQHHVIVLLRLALPAANIRLACSNQALGAAPCNAVLTSLHGAHTAALPAGLGGIA